MGSAYYCSFVNEKLLRFFLFLHENVCCWYSLEMPQRCITIRYVFLKNKKMFS